MPSRSFQLASLIAVILLNLTIADRWVTVDRERAVLGGALVLLAGAGIVTVWARE